MTEPSSQNETIITLADLGAILRRRRRTILVCTLTCALLGAFSTLLRPAKYEAEGTFVENTSGPSVQTSGLRELFIGSTKQSGKAATLLESRRLMTRVAERLGLQATVTRTSTGGRVKTIRNNLKIAYADWKGIKKPVVIPIEPDLLAHAVTYSDEVSTSLRISFTSATHYTVTDPTTNKALGTGELDSPFVWTYGKFTLGQGSGDHPTKQSTYNVRFEPLSTIAKRLAKDLEVDSKAGEQTLELTYSHPNRHMAAQVVNTSMEVLEELLREDNDRTTESQLSYLAARQAAGTEDLKALMDTYAARCSEDISSQGYFDSDKWLSFLSAKQLELRGRSMALDLELARLERICSGSKISQDQLVLLGALEPVRRAQNDITALRSRRDSLELAIKHNTTADGAEVGALFERQLAEAEMIRENYKDARDLLAYLDDHDDVPPRCGLIERNHSLVGPWYARLTDSYAQLSQASTEDAQRAYLKERQAFRSYIDNVARLLEVKGSVLQDRLTHQQSPQLELQGITLEEAQRLNASYIRALEDQRMQQRELGFLAEQVADPNLDLSALSVLLNDAIGSKIAVGASDSLLRMYDDKHLSGKELARMEGDLDHKRQFLQAHLHQQSLLLALNEELLEEKVNSIQNVTLDLLNQEIALRDKEVADFLASHTEGLRMEKATVVRHLTEIEQQMAALPERWFDERIISMQLEEHENLVETVTKMVESTVLKQNLELSQSAPLDLAVVPILPAPPKLRLFTILGTVAGLFMSCCFLLAQAILRGVPASVESLRITGHSAAGTLTRSRGASDDVLNDRDLATLRRVVSYACDESATDKGRVITVLEGPQCTHAHHLARLLGRRGKRIVLLPLTFDGSDGDKGLCDYLEGRVKRPEIVERDGLDVVVGGSASRYASELATSARFSRFLSDLGDQYDWVVVYSRAPITDAEAESLLSVSQRTVVTVDGETLEELTPYCAAANSGQLVSFVVVAE